MSIRRRLVERIRTHGPVTFAEYVDAALYDPDGGFYARGRRLGLRGAFSTAPTRQEAFVDAVAAEVRACHEACGAPAGFALVEVGPGDGSLAAGLGERLAGVVARFVLVERAEGMRAAQSERLAGSSLPVTWVAEPGEVEVEAGFVVANELFDALAFRLLDWPDEVLVGADPAGRLREESRPAPPELTAQLEGVNPRPGGRYAVRPELGQELLALAATVRRGRTLIADYGGESAEIHTGRDPVRTYVGGMRGGSPLDAPGSQDLTADVDFGVLRAAARDAGLAELVYEPQEVWQARVAPGPRGVFDPAPGTLAAFKVLLVERR